MQLIERIEILFAYHAVNGIDEIYQALSYRTYSLHTSYDITAAPGMSIFTNPKNFTCHIITLVLSSYIKGRAPVGSYVVLEIDLPGEVSTYPLAAVVQVVRVVPLQNKRFDIGVKTVNLSREDADKIMRYVLRAD